MTESLRDVSFCAYAILESKPFIVPEANSDERFKDNVFVIKDPFVRFYAGFPLITPQDYKLGTAMCFGYCSTPVK